MEFSASNVPAGSLGTRPVYRMLGNTLALETLYPSAISPTLSIAILPIQRELASGEYVPCWNTDRVPVGSGLRETRSSYQRTPVTEVRLLPLTLTEWLTTSDSTPARLRYASRYISRSASESTLLVVPGCELQLPTPAHAPVYA